MTKQKILVALMSDSPIAAGVGEEIAELSLEQLIETEPRVDELQRAVREEIGRKLRDARAAAGISLEDMRDKFGIDSGSLSRIERGQRWSAEIAGEALKVYQRERAKQDKAATKQKAKAGA